MQNVCFSVVESFKVYANQVMLPKIVTGLKKNNMDVTVEQLASFCEFEVMDGKNIVLPEAFSKKVAMDAQKKTKTVEKKEDKVEANGKDETGGKIKCKYSTSRMPKCEVDAVEDGYCKKHRTTDGVKKLLAKEKAAGNKQLDAGSDSESGEEEKKPAAKRGKAAAKAKKEEPGVKQVEMIVNKLPDGRYLLMPQGFVAEMVDETYTVVGKKDELSGEIRDLTEDENKIVPTMGGLKVAPKADKPTIPQEKKEDVKAEKKKEKVEETSGGEEEVIKKIARKPRSNSTEKKADEVKVEKSVVSQEVKEEVKKEEPKPDNSGKKEETEKVEVDGAEKSEKKARLVRRRPQN